MLIDLDAETPRLKKVFNPAALDLICSAAGVLEAKVAMSDSEEHQFESKADAGASKTYPMQAGAIRKNGHIVIKNRPCKVFLPRFRLPSNPGLDDGVRSRTYVCGTVMEY